MKKILFGVISLILIIMTGCGKVETIKLEKEIILDYSSSTTLSKDIKDKKDVKGKNAKVLVVEVIELKDGLTKFKSNNNLEFMTDEKIEINKEDYIVLNIIEEPTQKEDNFQIEMNILKVIKTKDTNNEPSLDENTTKSEDNTIIEQDEQIIPETKIKMDNDSGFYIGLDKIQVENQLKEMGFTNIKLEEIKTTDAKNKTNTVKSVLIKNEEFTKDTEFEKTDEVIITYWKYENPTLEYDLAFIRKFPDYSLYYMFDTDTQKVVYFGTFDSYIDKGTYTGDFSSGVTINWSHGEWKEKFIIKNGGNSAIMIDNDGFDWNYEKCDVIEAQKVLDNKN